ncbi:MAG: hypothetical protein E7296_09700 [Lachnospiraceae bacterium]|jgi:hypothetical protein|nr:hypothetical protein [Lachnospiraceae bacterium]
MPGIAGFIGHTGGDTKTEISKMGELLSYEGIKSKSSTEYENYHTCSVQVNSSYNGIFEDEHVVVSFYGEIFKISGISMEHSCITDAETVFRYIDRFGIDVIKKFNGSFAIAYYEKSKRILILATDRMSTRRIYFWRNEDIFAFSSETKAFYALKSFTPKPDYLGIGELLTNRFCMGERSLWEGVVVLKPGTILTFEGGRVNFDRYWDGSYERNESQKDDYWVERLYESIKDAVEIRTPDADLAMGLSGGCDARTVLGLLPIRGERIHSFTYGPSNSGDVLCAKMLAEAFGTDEEIVAFSNDDLIKDASRIVYRTDGVGEADLFFHIKMTELKRQKAQYEVSSVPGDAISGKMNSETALLLSGNKVGLKQERKNKIFKDLYKRGLAGKPNLNDDSVFCKDYIEEYRDQIEQDYVGACQQRCTSDDLAGIMFQHQLFTATTGRSIPVMAGVPASLLNVRLPLLDNEVLDCCGEMPAGMWRFQKAYLSMIEQKLPKSAIIPHYVTGTPVSPSINRSFMYLKLKDYLLRKVRIQQKNNFLSDTYDFKREIIQRDEQGYVAEIIGKEHVLNDRLFKPLSRKEIDTYLAQARSGDERAYKKIQCRFNAAVLSEVFFEGKDFSEKLI